MIDLFGCNRPGTGSLSLVAQCKADKIKITWQFSVQSARSKLNSHYAKVVLITKRSKKLSLQSIEFNFRDAKQFWGLEDFTNVTQTAVNNAANLGLFMVDVSQVLMCEYQQNDPDFSVLDVKANWRRYYEGIDE